MVINLMEYQEDVSSESKQYTNLENYDFPVFYCDNFYKYIMSIFEFLSCRTKPDYEACNGEEPDEVYFQEPIKRNL